jgi:hypothetical protein
MGLVGNMQMRVAIIESGVVANIAVADPEFAQEQGWVVSETAQIGDLWDGATFTPPPVTDAEIEAQWSIIRSERNNLIARTDWWVTKAAETGTTISPEQHAYRQALRDITDQGNPFAIVWPETVS